MNLHKAEFRKSVVNRKDFMMDKPSIVFAGKSNVGKSSVINKLLNRKNFARVGNTPGKTVHINYFEIDGKCYFVDLPGYGYAKVAKDERDRWGKLMETFFATEGAITLGVQIVDARHKPTADDITMAQFFMDTDCAMVVVANKKDKLKKSEYEPNVARIRETLELPDEVPVVLFSAEKGDGREELLEIIKSYV
ncbi:MAG: YihA family ribosome biogenesis GTP-binding protein [Oscillospiraceae bacterium]|nr:YihA family ribosome biogenesis GTP-binding protein [Oscillospiraceae bacterium]